MYSDLVYDVGMHVGQDTRAYLDAGFRVVAIEANPHLCKRARRHFRAEIVAGQLRVVQAAIAPASGVVDFLLFRDRFFRRKDVFGAMDNHYADRNIREKRLRVRRIAVNAMTFDQILTEHGIPYYLKIDIEGSEMFCLDALRRADERPTYVSLEIDYLKPENAAAALELLAGVGYDGFKIVSQRGHGEAFARDASGPFGEDTAGDWVSVDAIREAFRGPEVRQLVWHDLHARRS